MPPTIPYHSPRSEPSPDSAGAAGKSSTSPSPGIIRDFEKPNARKRKSSTEEHDDDDDDDDDSHQPVKKTAHNMIEKRYRTNLNDKIAALRDSVPSLRIMSKSARGEDTTVDREELQGLTPAHKLNKATVLSKATEYIRHLEKRNSRLTDENAVMQQRIAAFEKLFMSGAMNSALSPHQHHAPPTPTTYTLESTIFAPSPSGMPGRPDPQGMIQVPDDMKRIIDAQIAAGQPYPVPPQAFRPNAPLVRQQQIHQQSQMPSGGWSSATPFFGKLMVGSLAGLMLLEAIVENEQSNETTDGRGLFALPIQIIGSLASNLNVRLVGYSLQAAHILYSAKVVLLLCCLWWALTPSLINAQPPSMKRSKQIPAALKAAPSLASPIHVRRQAWLTAIQTVWVPRRHIFLEASALSLKTLKLSLINLIGIRGYQILTGLTQDDEIARVKAWEIALDAQLAGGDIEISKRRLILTFLASSTLPTTPLRLMLKALHIRVLLWDCGPAAMQTPIQVIAAKYARSHWNEAKQLYRLTNQLRRSGEELSEELPDHLAALLEQDCDDVLNPSIIQRAHNLAWNRSSEHNDTVGADGMATVTDDVAVRSPMDAVAAWWSSMILEGVLTASLLSSEDEHNETSVQIDFDVSLAIRTAPVGSVAQQRALVARALLVNDKPGINILAALQAVGPVAHILTSRNDSGTVNFIAPLASAKESPSSQTTATELRTSLLCAMAIAHLEKFPPPEQLACISWIKQIKPACDVGLLGYTAAYKLMDCLAKHELAAKACEQTLENLSARLRQWTGSGDALERQIMHQVVERCLAVTCTTTGMNFETDTGYGSMSDAESDYEIIHAPDPDPRSEENARTDGASCGCGL
ncbi:hypothetical protein F4861DRAFT_532482 [Xylaria intraflava]|nr:hypothetical protein F4861DRAFT_532482 [Xylaria intraflava]